jgi:hypothetical protein
MLLKSVPLITIVMVALCRVPVGAQFLGLANKMFLSRLPSVRIRDLWRRLLKSECRRTEQFVPGGDRNLPTIKDLGGCSSKVLRVCSHGRARLRRTTHASARLAASEASLVQLLRY